MHSTICSIISIQFIHSNRQCDGTRGTSTCTFTNVDIESEVHVQYKLEKNMTKKSTNVQGGQTNSKLSCINRVCLSFKVDKNSQDLKGVWS